MDGYKIPAYYKINPCPVGLLASTTHDPPYYRGRGDLTASPQLFPKLLSWFSINMKRRAITLRRELSGVPNFIDLGALDDVIGQVKANNL